VLTSRLVYRKEKYANSDIIRPWSICFRDSSFCEYNAYC
jgi:hypothetical protein